MVAVLAGWLVTLAAHGQEPPQRQHDFSARSMAEAPTSQISATDRILHRFDFDERGQGNIEEVPKYWDQFRPPGFPHYARGGFDFGIGFNAPPSFHLSTEGRNVAYQYTGPDTRIRFNSEYRIEGFIKPDRLVHGRACLSAHFLDRSGRILIDTIVRSPWIGGAAENDWVRVELYLPAAPVESYSIGLIAWVVQEPVWNPFPTVPRHIPHRDVFGGAWFDDILIYSLPRAELFTSSPDNVLPSDDAAELRVILADHDDRALNGTVSIYAADGGLMEVHQVEVVLRSHAEPTRIEVNHLEPGIYDARLDVRARHAHVLSRRLRFARLGQPIGHQESLTRSFGLVIDGASRVDPDIEGELLLSQRVHSLKLPVWMGLSDNGSTLNAMTSPRSADRLHQRLLRNNFSVTAVLHAPPAVMAGGLDGVGPSLLELLSSSPGLWEPHLAAVAAPHAGTFRWWQIGPDDEPLMLDAERGNEIASNLKSALRPFIPDPRLAISASALVEPTLMTTAPPDATGPQQPTFEQVTVHVPAEISTEALPEIYQRWRRAGFDRVAMHIPPLPGLGSATDGPSASGQFERRSRLAAWAQRLFVARHAGASPVYVPQTWSVRETPTGRIIEPDETFLILRTLADVLGDAEPGPTLAVADNVKALIFKNGDSNTLAIWATGSGVAPVAPGKENTGQNDVQLVRQIMSDERTLHEDSGATPLRGGVNVSRHEVAIQLGNAAHQFDLWGRPTPLFRDALGRQVITLSPMPVLIANVDPLLVSIASSLRVTPNQVESGLETTRLTLDWDYGGNQNVTGRVTLMMPDGWTASPREFNVRWTPQRIARIPVDIRFNPNEPAGRKTIIAQVRLSESDHVLEIPFHIELGLSEIDVWGLAWLEGDHLIVRHAITNRSQETVHFRSAAGVPGHERQYRPFTDLRPGDTQSTTYRFSDASSLAGRQILMSLRELNDGRRSHNLVLSVP
jgi:hypothetical protein